LQSHDHGRFEVLCYSSVKAPDACTPKFKACADHWIDITQLSDASTAQRIRDDHIDILVDLSGHIGSNRLLIFAHKPAPVQATYLGYPDTTGLATMDYRLTDARHDPPGQHEDLYTEKLIRLPDA